MSVVHIAHRVEPVSREGDPGQSLAAPVHDPLWGLARQRLVGELAGEDTGSPVETSLRMRVDPLDGWRPTSDGPVLPFDARTQVLEAVVAGDAAGPSVRDAVDAGRRLAAALPADLVADLLASHPVVVAADTPRFLTRAAAVHPDGLAVAKELLGAAAGAGGEPSDADLAGALGTTTERITASRGALDEFARWCATTFGLGPGTWVPERIERRFEVATGGEPVLVAPAHTREVVDVPDIEVTPAVAGLVLDTNAVAGSETAPWLRRIPTRLRFPGMPNDRFWEFEDAQLALHRIDAATHDLARLALVEFSSTYGNDWFTFPVPVDHGTIATIPEIVVRDTFGGLELVPVATDVQWSMFVPTTAAPTGVTTGTSTTPVAAAAPHLVVPPVTVAPLAGAVVEEVRFVRDENANLVWALECTVTDSAGTVRNVLAEYTAAAREIVDLPSDAELLYRLMTEVPEHWVPFIPVQISDNRSVGLVEAVLPRPDTFGVPIITTPRSVVLRELRGTVIREEEIGSAGVTVRRRWHLARTTDGGRHTWVSREVSTGRGEGASGLAFDVAMDVRGR